jgi:hypothetical protein
MVDPQITAWLNPSEIHKTGYGVMSNKLWLLFEKNRIEKLGNKCEIRTDKKGRKALFYITE